jgi:hypothetical protein
MSETITITAGPSGFAEDKDQAKELRTTRILPAMERGEEVVLDFSGVRYATQSYIHALIGEALQRYREAALQKLEFRNCVSALRSVIELVVDYSLGGFAEKTAS